MKVLSKRICVRVLLLGMALRNEKYQVTLNDWKTFVNVHDLKETGIHGEVAILHVWGTCALWKKIKYGAAS